MRGTRYDIQFIQTENPDPVIERMEWFGWQCNDIRQRERTIRAHHGGSSVHVGGLGSYSGSTTYEREYWFDLKFTRDRSNPHYDELVACEQIWHSSGPGHRVVNSYLGPTLTFIGWFIGAFLLLSFPAGWLKAWDAYAAWRLSMGSWGFNLVYLAACTLVALPFAIRSRRFKSDPPLSEEELREYNNKGAEHTKRRYNALERAQFLTGTG
jgi:hypothetical protein